MESPGGAGASSLSLVTNYSPLATCPSPLLSPFSPGFGERAHFPRADEQHPVERTPRIADDVLRRRLAQVLSDVVRSRVRIRLEVERGGATDVAGGHRGAVPELHGRRAIPVQARQQHGVAWGVQVNAGTP